MADGLQVENLAAGYGGRAVARLSALRVEGGGAALLLGPSGAGKTTLLLAMAGLAGRTAGRVSVDGTDVGGLRGAALDRWRGRHVGLVFQDIHLVEGLSVLDNLLLAPFAAGAAQDAERARELLARLGLGDVAGRRAETLSRGQAQRAAIGRAMLLRPALILADEPTASLDDAGAEAVADLLLGAAAETGAALVIATHDARLRRRVPATVQAEPVS
jgi:putative ABC transport system ATP-binding protein